MATPRGMHKVEFYSSLDEIKELYDQGYVVLKILYEEMKNVKTGRCHTGVLSSMPNGNCHSKRVHKQKPKKRHPKKKRPTMDHPSPKLILV